MNTHLANQFYSNTHIDDLMLNAFTFRVLWESDVLSLYPISITYIYVCVYNWVPKATALHGLEGFDPVFTNEDAIHDLTCTLKNIYLNSTLPGLFAPVF